MVSTKNTILTALTYWILLSISGFAKNQLASETSPHLLQHADSLVDWYPWSVTAFEKARSENKPLFVSIGFHSSHWCHKMMVESFNNPATAKILNDHFINVKVDRAEFPDIDRIYLNYIQLSQGSGGWPLNVWLTPDLVPFSVGTYFPAEDSQQQPSFEKVLDHITNQWRRFSDYIDSQSRRDLSFLRTKIQDLPASDPSAKGSLLLGSYERLASEFDPQNGGFGSAPRFPNPPKLNTAALVLANERPGSFRAKQCSKMINLSLTKMANGGIHDHLGGGFHRYSSDPAWAIPHFEKMLSDQALIMNTFLTGYRLSANPNFLKVAQGIERYVTSTLSSPEGGFYMSQHSDSPASTASTVLKEGSFYKWTAKDFSAAAGADAALLSAYYSVRTGGNTPLDANSNAETDMNTLRVSNPMSEISKQFNLTADEAATSIARGKKNLLTARNARPTPSINKQIITAANALMISALTKSYAITGNKASLDRATAAMEFIHDRCYDRASSDLIRVFTGKPTKHLGRSEDFAFTIQASLDLYTASLDERWLMFADELQRIQNKLFFDKKEGGFFNTRRARTDIVIRLKSYEDEAGLSPNGSSILNLVRLGSLLGDEKYLRLAKQSIACFRGAIDRTSTLSWRLLLAELMLSESPTQIIVAGKRGQADTEALLSVAKEQFTPGKILLFIDTSAESNPLLKRNPKLARFQDPSGKALAHICKNFSCKAPTSDPVTMRTQLTGG